jgi:hypothetical protein
MHVHMYLRKANPLDALVRAEGIQIV